MAIVGNFSKFGIKDNTKNKETNNTTTTNSSYGANTNWANEVSYLDNLSKNGTAGEKAWAENQKKVLSLEAQNLLMETAKTQLGGLSGGSSGSSYSASTNWDNENAYLTYLSQYGTEGEKAWANNQLGVLSNAQTQYGGSTSGSSGYSYGANTNWDNERAYLENIIANGTDGNKKWATQQLNALANAQAQYGTNNVTPLIVTTPLTQEKFVNQDKQPTYENSYDPQMAALLNQILNREDFSYDVTKDPLYQQYADMYQREGDRAMRETMAEAAASAGGMNTYAMTAASQANNYYMSQLNDKIPELYKLAYGMYLDGIDQKIQDLGLLQNMDSMMYNRYRDTMNDWRADQNFAYGMYRDNIGDSQWQQQFDYNANRDNVYDSQWQQQFDYNKEQDSIANSQWKDEFDYLKEQDAIANSQWERVFAYDSEGRMREWGYEDRETAKEEVWKFIELGIMPSEDLITAAGMNTENVKQAVEAKTPLYEKVYSGKYGDPIYAGSNAPATFTGYISPDTTGDDGKGGSGGNGGTNQTVDKTGNDKPKNDGYGSVLDLGLGPINQEKVLDLVLAGAVIVNADGKYKWADGYGPSNVDEYMTDYQVIPYR